MVLIGSHVSMKGKEMLLGAAKEAVTYNSSTFMIYSGAPQNTRRKDISEMAIESGTQFMTENNLSDIVVHAPYIINLGNTIKKENYAFAVQFMRDEIMRAEALRAKQMTVHPGAHVSAGADLAIDQIAKGLNEAITEDQTVQIALETMAGKGTEIGRTFEELAQIIEKIEFQDKISVTLDTCHIHDAGYDVKNNFDKILEDFDRIIGLDKLKVIHVNDSKNPIGAHKDRHANIGFGHIGFEALNYVVHHPKLERLPKILETPYVGEDKKNKKAPYGHEIAMLRKQEFNPTLLEDILEGKPFI
ncbi:deoxyribonuclease IV [Lacticigenium naphthae]|uniref:deoxyribonuclease IV n=1 Tax=Lacticigenium naphthae TaxID=515351 RepID=UPI00040660A5|nr:deoxyribonuclease IV [Lacticigenium naphthae]